MHSTGATSRDEKHRFFGCGPVRLVCIVVCALMAHAHAQLIDLGGGSAPKVDSWTASSELAAFLNQQADEILSGEEVTPGLRAAARVRNLASALLKSGQSLGATGAPRLVIARTIVNNLESIDAALTTADPVVSGPRADLFAEDCNRLASALPRPQRDLDRALRDAFAPIVNALNVDWAAWGPIDQDDGSLLADLVDGPPDRIERLSNIDHMLARARSWPSHAPSAARTGALVRNAIRVLSQPAWMQRDARAVLERALDHALGSLVNPLEADDALVEFERLATTARLVEAVAMIEPNPLQRRMQNGVSALLTEFGEHPDRVARTCAAAARVIELAMDQSIAQRESTLPTFARVAWRHADADLNGARSRLISALIEQLGAPDPMTEPAVLSAIRSHRTAHALLEDISTIGAYLTGLDPNDAEGLKSRPRVLADRRLLGAAILKLGKQMPDPQAGEQAREQIARIAQLVRSARVGESEPLIRQNRSDPLFLELSGGRIDEILRALETLQGRAENGLKIRNPGAPDETLDQVVAQSQRLKELCSILVAGSVVMNEAQDRLEPWAPWELSEHGWDRLVEGLPERISDAASAVLAGQETDPEAFATIRLISVLVQRVGPWPEGEEPIRRLCAQIAMGVPPLEAFGVEDRSVIASICSDLEEEASAALRQEGERVQALREHRERTAYRMLEMIRFTDRQ